MDESFTYMFENYGRLPNHHSGAVRDDEYEIGRLDTFKEVQVEFLEDILVSQDWLPVCRVVIF